MSVNEIRDFIFENYHKGTGFPKKNSYYSVNRFKKKKKRFIVPPNKLIEKIPDPHNAKEHYQSFARKKTQNQ